jgi:signal peptidase I
MASAKLKRAWKKEYVQTTIMIVVVLGIVVGLWFGSQIVLGTQYPALAVASGSMCMEQHMNCDGWSHPFERTLHIGDLIIVKGTSPAEIVAGPDPLEANGTTEGDIIVFHKPKTSGLSVDDLIVHRVIAEKTENGLIYFRTKGDGNPGQDDWVDYRGENYTSGGMISQNLLVGKVIMRVPWVGHLALFMRNTTGIYIVIGLILLLVVVELILPSLRGKKAEEEKKQYTGDGA